MQWIDQNRHREARAAARLKALVQRYPKASGLRDRAGAAPKVSHGNQTKSRNRRLAWKRTVATVTENGPKSCMARKNAQTPKGVPTRAANHKATPITSATTTTRMLDGKENWTKKKVHGHNKDRAVAKTATSTTKTSTTIRDKQRMAGTNNHGMDGSIMATGQRTPQGHKINNDSQRSNNFNQMRTAQP